MAILPWQLAGPFCRSRSGFVFISDGIHRLCMLQNQCFLVSLCFLSLFTEQPWESKCSKMAEQGQCFRNIQNCHFLVTVETFSLCSLLLFSWNCMHNKGLFPLMRKHPGYTGILLTIQITKLKMRYPTQPDKISDGQRACADKCIYLKQILPAASGKTTTYE